jgi:NAD-dependent dihydropyrimidine dehydrogenase PreA subunit/flavodoxin
MTKIIYFSATGNSLYISKILSKEMDAELISLNKAPLTLKDDKIGFVFPVYCGDLPFNIKDYLNKVIIDSNYIFSIAVCGGSSVRANLTFSEILKSKNLNAAYYGNIILPDNSIIFKGLYNDEINNKAKKDIDKIINDIKNGIILPPFKNNILLKPYCNIMWFTLKKIFKVNKRKIDKDKCINCGQCIKLCPKHNITIKDGNIIFGNDCVYCFGCIHWCPKNAIFFGKLKVNNKTAYHHPEINVNEIIDGNKLN